MRVFFAVLISIQALLIAWPSNSAAASDFITYTTDCIVTRDVRTLKRGQRVYTNGVSYMLAFGAARLTAGEFTPEDIPDNAVECSAETENAQFPLVLLESEYDALLSEQFGLKTVKSAEFGEGRSLANGGYRCFAKGAGQERFLELSSSLVEKLIATHFGLHQACMLLQSGQVRFDPETGHRLPTYVIASENHVSPEFLFYPPLCFTKGVVKFNEFQLIVVMNPLGCQLNYHPWSGRPLEAREAALLSQKLTLWSGGEGGGSAEDSRELAKDVNRRATAAKIEAIRNIQPK